jgi:hypothetical protein
LAIAALLLGVTFALGDSVYVALAVLGGVIDLDPDVTDVGHVVVVLLTVFLLLMLLLLLILLLLLLLVLSRLL